MLERCVISYILCVLCSSRRHDGQQRWGLCPMLFVCCVGVNYTKHKEYKKLHIPNNNTHSIIVWGCARPLYSSHTTPQPPTTPGRPGGLA